MKHRLYSFVNHLYMSPLQWGIQTAHCVSTMTVLYSPESPQGYAFNEWAQCDPTIIVCRGGNVASLTDLSAQLHTLSKTLKLATCSFYEDASSLGGIITAVAVLVPETLFEMVYDPAFDAFFSPIGVCISKTQRGSTANRPEYDLLKIVKLARLA